MEPSLYSCIQKIKHGDQEQMLFLLDTFEPLLKKYARLLHSEDAFEELQCFLLSFAKEMPLEKLDAHTNGVVVKYISKAVYHQYIAISKERKKQPRTVYIEEQKGYDLLQYDAVFGESDTYSGLLLHDLKDALTDEEYHIIYEHFVRQRSIQEIASQSGKSRQSVNKHKNSALRKLRKYWDHS